MRVQSLYTDGGLLGRNPCSLGGTWAWCHVTDDVIINHDSGIVEPHEIKMPAVSNNITELLAMYHGLDALPNGWDGIVCTDSFVTMRRIMSPSRAKFHGVPSNLVEKIKLVRCRLGNIRFMLLGGHPSKDDLARGSTRDGTTVSIFNKWCDTKCNEARQQFEMDVAAYERSK